MKRIFLIIALFMMLPCAMMARDARQRTPQTIVADVLAEIPFAQRADFDSAMSDLLNTGNKGVINLADMLVPAQDGANSRVEYALDGLVSFATSHATKAQRDALCEGLDAAIVACNDNPNKQFLLTLLARISRPEDAQLFMTYLADPYLAETAQSGLILTAGTDDIVLSLIERNELPHTTLARLAGAKGLTAAEPVLLSWLKNADVATTASIHKALERLGTVKSLPVLEKAAAAEKYQWLTSDATASYVALLNRLASTDADSKTVIKYASNLIKKGVGSHVRSGAVTAVLTSGKNSTADYLYKAMSDPDRQYRVAALRAAQPWADDAVCARLAAIALNPKTPVAAVTDIVNWYGDNNVTAQTDVVLAGITADDDELAAAAIAAASRLGGDAAADALVAQLGGKRNDEAYKALLSFKGTINDKVVAALAPDRDAAMRGNALRIASTRHIKAAAPVAFTMLDDSDAQLQNTAYASLAGVVSPGDIRAICMRLESAPASRTESLQAALIAAVSQVDPAAKYAAIAPYVLESKNPSLYYQALAVTGSPEAIATLVSAYGNDATRQAAFSAMLQLDNPAMIDTLYDIAENSNDTDANAAALTRYAALVDRHVDSPVTSYQLYKRALEISKSAAVDNILLEKMAGTGTYQALMIADRYIDRPDNANTAAATIRAIMSKHIDEYTDAAARAALVKAADVFRADKYNADAGYAVDDINGMLSKLDARSANAVEPVSSLTDEERALGFEMLFDGTSLNKWTGDKNTYIVQDGCIAVSDAHWGDNIYTVDEYGNFVFRFEFSLDRPGVNNGVGIRTPMNVDAAFHGMEIQILDHDDPMYRDLEPYQVHGSIYGVIPAKRVKFKHEEWNTEEIRAEGDHITVTVNGKVILDGNIREACQGHAVGDPGEEGNHYMIDHRNHPGLFNKSGHIGFLGHGAGIRFRNVRVLDLDKK